MLTLSSLVGGSVAGNVHGRCIFCGRDTAMGHKATLKERFTMYDALHYGDVICEYCYYMYNNQQFRNKSWVVTQDGVIFLRKEDIKDFLLSPPQPPFALYVTKAGQKQGWIKLMNRVSYSREMFFVGTDFSDMPIFVYADKIRRMFDVASRLIRAGLTKTELLSIDFAISPKKFLHICEKYREDMEAAKRFVGQLDWELIIFAI